MFASISISLSGHERERRKCPCPTLLVETYVSLNDVMAYSMLSIL